MPSFLPSLRIILLGVGLFATIIAVLLFSGKLSFGTLKTKVMGDVIMWGTLPDVQMSTITNDFNPKAKTYAVRYTYIPEEKFNQRLLEALASGTGPDMILTPYQIILSQADRIYPYQIPEKNFRDIYVDGAEILSIQQGVLALPVSIEPMVLFYNRTLFSKHGIINPPTLWDEIITLAPLLNIKDGGRFAESAVALGTPQIPYAKDIIMTIIQQLGQTPIIRMPNQGDLQRFSILMNTPVVTGGEVLPLSSVSRFYSQFGDPGQNAYSWNQERNENASDVFVSEKLAMYIGYSGEYQTLKSRNPRGDFQMTLLPQSRGYNTFSTGMRMYALATLKSTKNLNASLTVQGQFAGSGISPALASVVGGVPALRSYAGDTTIDPVIARSMLVARGWYDSYPKETTGYVSAMISDIINYRKGVNEATGALTSRFIDLYNKN